MVLETPHKQKNRNFCLEYEIPYVNSSTILCEIVAGFFPTIPRIHCLTTLKNAEVDTKWAAGKSWLQYKIKKEEE